MPQTIYLLQPEFNAAMLKYLIPLIVFSCLVILFVFGLQNDPSIVPSPFIDKPLPQISLPTLSDPSISIDTNDLKGEVTLINIWATWCIPCRQEHALLVDLAKNNDVKVVGLNYKDNRDDAMKWLVSLGDPYNIVLFDEDGKAGIDLGLYGVPETFIIDKNAIVKHKHIGPLTEENISETIIPMIKELKVTPLNNGLNTEK
ncbi:MAG: DsbE family thiol:disulfide interchange protein [Gammaproteobacteria bacterium]